MVNWPRLVLMMFYAPARAMREVRDRGALAPAGLVALLAHALFFFSLSWFYLGHLINPRQPLISATIRTFKFKYPSRNRRPIYGVKPACCCAISYSL